MSDITAAYRTRTGYAGDLLPGTEIHGTEGTRRVMRFIKGRMSQEAFLCLDDADTRRWARNKKAAKKKAKKPTPAGVCCPVCKGKGVVSENVAAIYNLL